MSNSEAMKRLWANGHFAGRKPTSVPKTECKRGHKLEGDNVLVTTQGRQCRACNLMRDLSRYQRKRLAAFGITQEQFDELAARGCAICLRPLSRDRNAHLDHDHETNQFRDLLCVNCNTGLGCFMDSPALLQAAISYLSKHGKVTNGDGTH